MQKLAGTRWHRLILGLVTLGWAAGCAEKDNRGGQTQGNVDEPVQPAAAASWENPSDRQCREFAEALEASVLVGDMAVFDAAIDWDAILESATGGIEGVDEARRGFIAGFRKNFATSGGLPKAIAGQIEQD